MPKLKSNNIVKTLKNNTMVLVLVAIIILFQVLITAFEKGSLLNPANITNIINQNAYVVILATGMLMCILTGGNIDLSIGSIVCLVGAVCGTLIVNNNWPVSLTIAICLLVGLAIGAWHGLWIAYVHVPPFICTLSGMLLWRGVALIILNGLTISPFPQNYMNLFSSYIPEVFIAQEADETIEEMENDFEMYVYDETEENDEATDDFAIADAEETSDYSTDDEEIEYFDFSSDNEDEEIEEEQDPNARRTMIVTLAVSLLTIIIMLLANIYSRISKKKKGYDVGSLGGFCTKLILLSAVIATVGIFLALDRGIPVVLILVGVIVAVYSYFTQNTVPGRYLYAIGGNEKAARLSGVNTDHVMFFAYTNMGFLSAVAALVCTARFNSAAPTAGTNYEMDAIASCFIGGASAYGGTGTVGGAVVGAIFMGVLNNGMSILGVDSNWQRAVKGMVLLLAVIFDVVSKRKKSK